MLLIIMLLFPRVNVKRDQMDFLFLSQKWQLKVSVAKGACSDI